jgi:hypothetical protein
MGKMPLAALCLQVRMKKMIGYIKPQGKLAYLKNVRI